MVWESDECRTSQNSPVKGKENNFVYLDDQGEQEVLSYTEVAFALFFAREGTFNKAKMATICKIPQTIRTNLNTGQLG